MMTAGWEKRWRAGKCRVFYSQSLGQLGREGQSRDNGAETLSRGAWNEQPQAKQALGRESISCVVLPASPKPTSLGKFHNTISNALLKDKGNLRHQR